VNEQELLAARFEEHRGHLRAVAYRLLGSLSEADDALQEAWLRFSRAETDEVMNLGGWLTTVVARVCLNQLQLRRTRREEPLGAHRPEPIVGRADGSDPEQAALLADAVDFALLVVLEALDPVERVAFVLHDVFAVPFDTIAPIVGRSSTATRQLASRARRRVRGASTMSDTDLPRHRSIVDAFLAAARGGDFEALLAILAPDVVLRTDRSATSVGVLTEVRGARAVAERASTFAHLAQTAQPAFVNGAAGVVSWGMDGLPLSVMGFTIASGRIVAIDTVADPARLRRLDLAILKD
jgi:RNA polymerase sigma-70 factor (ECF subfamily)